MPVRERWFFDGWELTVGGGVRDWASRAGTDVGSGYVGENTPIPGRAGELWTPKWPGPGRFEIDLWLAAGSAAELNAAWRVTQRAMRRGNRLVNVRRVLPSGEVVVCAAEVVGTIQPIIMGQNVARAQVTFSIPDGVWRSETSYANEVSLADGALSKNLVMTNFEPCTETMDNLVFEIYGPIQKPALQDFTDGIAGDSISFTNQVPASCLLTINTRTWEITPSNLPGNTQSLNWFRIDWFNYTGSKFLTVAHAAPGNVPQIKVTSLGGLNASSKVRVVGPRTYAS